MSRITRLLSLCAALLVLVAPCRAQINEAIDIVPADSLGFLMIKDLRQFSDKIQQTAAKLGIGERVSFLELIKKEMGIAEGINDNGSAVFILTKAKDKKSFPDVIVALPITDRQKIAQQVGLKELTEDVADGQVGIASGLLGGVGGVGGEGKAEKFPVSVARRGNFLLITQRDGTFWPSNAKESLRMIVASKQSLKTALQPAKTWLDEQDLAGICTDKGISHGLGLFMAGGGGAASSDTKGQADQLKGAFADLEKNVNLVAFGGKIEDNLAWRLSTALHFKADGEYAKWIAKAEPADDAVLKMFPDAPKFAVAVARISAQFSLDGAAKFMPKDIPADKRESLAKEMSKLLQQISDVGVCVYSDLKEVAREPFAWVDTFFPFSGPATPIVIARVRDAGVFLDDAVDLLKRAQRTVKLAGDVKTEVNYQEKDIAGKPSRLFNVTTRDKGKESTSSFLLTAIDNKTVLACFLDRARPEEIIAKYAKAGEQSLATNAALKTARALLPKTLQAEVFVDLHTFGFLQGRQKVANSPAPPLAFSLRVIPAAVEAQFAIPFEAMKAVFDDSVGKGAKGGGSAPKAQTANNMTQLSLAMLSFHDAYSKLPPAAICDKNGKPLLSWRVAILPFVKEDALYQEFKLDEPWDSEHNKKLLPRMPKVFQMPGKTGVDRTHYRVPVGKGAIFPSPSDKVSLKRITDGTAKTILIVETAESVPWTKPEEFDFGPGPLPKLLSRDGTICVLLADTGIRCLPETVREAALRAAFTRDGGEKLELPDD
jgi:hypothetical protein